MNDLSALAMAQQPDDQYPEADQALSDAEGASSSSGESQTDKLMRWCDPSSPINIAEELDQNTLTEIAMRSVEEYDIDEASRREWVEQARIAMDLAMQRIKPKTSPWPGASNVIFPLMTEAADQFAARAYPAIVDNNNVVKGVVYGDDGGTPATDPQSGQPVVDPQSGQPQWAIPPNAKHHRADAIGAHMSWQLLEEQEEWEPETDALLHVLPIVGCDFRKTYYDPVEGRNMSCRASAFDVVINYWAKSMATAPRVSEVLSLYPYEIEEHQRSHYFLSQDYGLPPDGGQDRDAPHKFIEQHRRWDLDGDGYPEPYIVTVHKETQKIARIVARFDPEGVLFDGERNLVKIVPIQYYTKYDFMPNKEGGIYGQGFAQLLRPINDAVNTTINMLIDAGHLQTVGGGFIGKGLSMHSGAVKLKMGSFTPVNAPGGQIRDSIVPLKFDGPSPVLFTLLGMMIDAGKNISSVKDVLTGEVKAQTMSPTVFLALVEQGLKVFTAIWKRVRRSLKSEFQKLYRLNRLYLEEEASYQIGDEWKKITRQDYERGSGVKPISDANMVVDVQRMAKAQFLDGFKSDPMMNGAAIRRRILEAAAIDNIDELLQVQPAPDPMLLAKAAELQLRKVEVRARAIMNMAMAVKALADADKAVAEQFNTWAMTQIQMMQGAIEDDQARQAGGADAADAAAGNSGGGQGANAGELPGMAPSSSNGSAAPVS